MITPVALQLKQLRQQQGWSQQEVAAMLGISIPAISKIETGITDVTLSRLMQFAALYQLPVSTLFGGDEADTLEKQLSDLRARLHDREREVGELQAKLIALHEETRRRSKEF